MRAIVAKRLRKLVYGPKGSSRVRELFVGDRFKAKNMPKNLHGCAVADQKRREYQWLKKRYVRKIV